MSAIRIFFLISAWLVAVFLGITLSQQHRTDPEPGDEFRAGAGAFQGNDGNNPAKLPIPVLARLAAENLINVSGHIYDASGPVSGALVRVHSQSISTTSAEDGYFHLEQLSGSETLAITTWAPGYYNQYTELPIGADNILQIQIEPYTLADNTEYEWLSANVTAGQERNCVSCHSDPEHPEQHLAFDDWNKSAHAQSATNPLFLSLYQGSDLDGNISPATRYGNSQDYGHFPLPPDHSKAYYGPGYKLDFPQTDGNCATCHTPYAAVNDPYGINPLQVNSIANEGVGCDYCHKIKGVVLNHQSMPVDGNPGVLSYQLARPEPERNLFLGSFDDMAPGDDSFSPLYRQGQICAGCHYGKFWDVVVYNSYGEWLLSDYSNPRTGKSCQQCHMPSGLTDRVVKLDSGGKLRDPDRIHSHQFIGGEDSEFLRSAATMEMSTQRIRKNIEVSIVIKNKNAGHHFPTGSPLRHLILVVEAIDQDGSRLTQLSGKQTPEWTGEYAGKAGTAYAKVLEELWTGIYPTAAFWNQTTVRSDNRIPARGQDLQTFQFLGPEQGDVTISATLLYRRSYEALRKTKKWPKQDFVLSEASMNLERL